MVATVCLVWDDKDLVDSDTGGGELDDEGDAAFRLNLGALGMTDLQEEGKAAPTAIEQVRSTIAEIGRRLVAIDERLAFNRELRAQAGLPLNGGQVQRLNDLRDESNRLDKERDDLTIWLRQWEGKEAEALRQEGVAADVIFARRRIEVAELVRQGGVALDEGFSAARFAGWNALLDELIATRLSC
jgi:hypothetical protein